jgi:hypothetical protein
VILDLVSERVLGRKALQVDDQHGWESRKRERLVCFTQRFASWAVPIGDLRWSIPQGRREENHDVPRVCLFHHFGLDKRIETVLYVNLAVLD